MKQDAKAQLAKRQLPPQVYMIPGPQEPLPGRSHPSDYWPVFPFQNQFSGGLDLDPSISRHIGGDLNVAIPSYGMMDIWGRFFNRIHDTTTKFGYLNHPVNMMDLEKEDFVELMSNPSTHWNRAGQPTIPLGKLAKTHEPLNCKAPLCNPYTMTFGLGIEHDWGGSDGVEGDIDVPFPLSKGVAYRMPFSGKIYYDRDNLTVTYGHNINQIDPFHSLFDYQNHRNPAIAIPRELPLQNLDRRKRQVQVEIINNESKSVPVHPETAAKGQIDAIVRHLHDPQPIPSSHNKVAPLAKAPPAPAPIPLPEGAHDATESIQNFYSIGKDTASEDRKYKPSPLIEDRRFNVIPKVALTGEMSDVDAMIKKLYPNGFLSPSLGRNFDQEDLMRKLLAEMSQQPVQPMLNPYLKLKMGPNLIEQVLEQQVQTNALLEEEINSRLRQLNLGPLNLKSPITHPQAPPPLPILPIHRFFF
ncbi:unnamed protein product, partial [Mesorhabditis belari]|uniref:Uncharacterized protein n=1 Tax=Mesorhabditis belari TaxID=2138241 RepID=A0AAF3F8Y4_9BILA